MADKPKKQTRSGRRGDPISLAPLTPAEAMAGLLKVKPADVKKLEASEAKDNPKRKAKK